VVEFARDGSWVSWRVEGTNETIRIPLHVYLELAGQHSSEYGLMLAVGDWLCGHQAGRRKQAASGAK
jgi:hypothetical protein